MNKRDAEKVAKLVAADPRGRMARPGTGLTQITFLSARALAGAKKNLGKRPKP